MRFMKFIRIVLAFALALGCLNAEAQNPSDTQCGLAQAIKVHSFESVSLENLMRIIPVMEAHRNSHGFIITYAGRSSSLAAAQKSADVAKRQILAKQEWINQSDVLNARLNTLVCGYRETPATELWVTPVGAAPPVCAATIAVPETRPKRPPRRRR